MFESPIVLHMWYVRCEIPTLVCPGGSGLGYLYMYTAITKRRQQLQGRALFRLKNHLMQEGDRKIYETKMRLVPTAPYHEALFEGINACVHSTLKVCVEVQVSLMTCN